MGTVFAHDGKAYRRWSRGRERGRQAESGGLSGAALEGAVAALARQHGEYVVYGQ